MTLMSGFVLDGSLAGFGKLIASFSGLVSTVLQDS